jgi:hypothetical protein
MITVHTELLKKSLTRAEDALVLQPSLLHKAGGIPIEPPATCGGEVEFVLLLLPELLESDPLSLQDMGLQPILWSTILDNQTHSGAVPKHMQQALTVSRSWLLKSYLCSDSNLINTV